MFEENIFDFAGDTLLCLKRPFCSRIPLAPGVHSLMVSLKERTFADDFLGCAMLKMLTEIQNCFLLSRSGFQIGSTRKGNISITQEFFWPPSAPQRALVQIRLSLISPRIFTIN